MKKSRISLKLILIIFVFCMVIATSACSFGDTNVGGYTVGLNLNGGEGVEAKDFISGSKLVEPANTPVKRGCDFLGWFYESTFETEVTFDVKITKNIIIYAKWSELRWVVTFIYGGDIESTTQRVADKAKAIEPTVLPEKHGHEFKGWYKNSNYASSFRFTESIVEDISIYAKWSIANYTINYHFDEGTPHPNTVYKYTINYAVTLAFPSREGYDFLGWYDNENFNGSQVTTIVKGSYGNKDFYAKYICYKNDIERTMLGAKITANTISINVNYLCDSLTLDYNNIIVSDRATFAVFDENLVDLDYTIEMPDAPGIEDDPPYVVVNAIIRVTSEKGDSKDHELTIKKYAEGASVTVSFDTGIANAIGTKEVPISTTIDEPEINEVLGYTFGGWYDESDFVTIFDFNSLIGSDKTLYARFMPITYNISYNLGVGKNVVSNADTYTINDVINFSDGVNTDLYNFDGWYRNNTFTEAIVQLIDNTGDISIYAKYILKEDLSAMVLSYIGNQTFTSEQNSQLSKYLEYVVFNKTSTASFTLDLDDENYDNFIQNAWKNVTIPKSTIGWEASRNAGNITIIFTYKNYPDKMASVDNKYTQLDYLVHDQFEGTRTVSFDGFKINSIDNKVDVSNSETLFYALSQGYRPMPVTASDAERIYNKAKTVLRDIIDDSMTDIEKLHKIYDWLILNVTYDKELFDLTTSATPPNDIHSYNGFYLEGIFDDLRAVCDGISKAFVVLARIEGIEAYQVIYSPEDASVGHAWNKARIDGKYYIIDATSGGTIINTDEVLTHKYFMLTESKFKEVTSKGKESDSDYFAGYQGTTHTDKVAETVYDVYSDIIVGEGEDSFDMVISSQEELNILVLFFKNMSDDNDFRYTIDAYIAFDYGEDIDDEMRLAVNYAGCQKCSRSFDKGYLILIVSK